MPISSRSLAATPPMGWNSWNMFGGRISEEKVLGTADALVSSGLKGFGYEYLVIDDCWSKKNTRDGHGDLVPDPEKFPNGLKPVVDYAHGKGLKVGIYSDAAECTCGGHPGSYGFETQDAAFWASQGFDFLKYDYCNAPNEQDIAMERYSRMGRALAGSGREFLFSLCEWGGRSPWLWGTRTGGKMWRVSGDVFDSWVDVWVPNNGRGYYGIGIDHSFDIAASLADWGGPGAWNDLDMLIVGLKGKGAIHGGGLSSLEYRAHMSLWCMACSPLMIGCDVTAMDAETTALLTNRDVLAVNQDVLGIPARRVKAAGGGEVWRKPLSDGGVAVMVVNRGHSGMDVPVKAGDLGLLDHPKPVKDLWSGEPLPELSWERTYRVQPHEALLLKVGV